LGDSQSESYIGDAYANGTGVPQDDKLAFQWWLSGADKGSADAKFHVATRYKEGRGVEQSDFLFAVHLERATSHQTTVGFAARYLFGHVLVNGIGCAKDESRAVFNWNTAASRGNKDAKLFVKCNDCHTCVYPNIIPYDLLKTVPLLPPSPSSTSLRFPRLPPHPNVS
jgi:TPR repeat protein